MNPQILKDIKALSTIQPEHIRKYDRMDVVIKFMQAKKEHPDYNKNQLCALIGVSDSYLKRIMKDLDIKSFYRHDIPINKTYKMKPNKNSEQNHIHETETSDRIEDIIIKNPKDTKIKSKYKRESSKNIKGGGKNPEGEVKGSLSTDDITDEYIDKLINSFSYKSKNKDFLSL